MKKFLLLLVGVMFALSAKAADYYLVGDPVGSWSSTDYNFAPTATDVFELEINGKVKAGEFKINGGGNDWSSVNIGAKGSNAVTISFGTVYEYDDNSSSNKNFNFPSEQSYALFVLNTTSKTLTVYNSKPLKAHVPSGKYCFYINGNSWATPTAYLWNNDSNNGWPGKAMSKYGYTELCLWEDATLSFEPEKILFNSGSNANQTSDKTFTNGAVYDKDGNELSTTTYTYYFDVAGSDITTPTLSIGWATVAGTETDKKGVFKFELKTALPAEYWAVSFTDDTHTYAYNKALTQNNVYKVESSAVTNKGPYANYNVPTGDDVTIYFTTSGVNNWAQPHIYLYQGGTALVGAFPGVQMNKVDGTETVWTYTISASNYSKLDGAVLSNGSEDTGNKANDWYKANIVNGHLFSLDNLLQVFDNGEYVGCNTYKYSGDNPGSSTEYTDEAMTDNGNGTWSITRTFKNGTNFGIRGFYNTLRLSWLSAPTAEGKSINAEGDYDISNTGASNFNFAMEDGKYTLTFNPTTGKLNVKKAATTTYYYRLHGSIFTNGVKEDGGWYTQKLMTKNADGTYSFTATIQAGEFGIKRLESESEEIDGTNTWINSPSSVTMVADTEYDAEIQSNGSGTNFKTDLSGKYTIIFNPTTMKVKFVAGTVTPTGNYVWRLHTDIITGSWPAADNTLADYAMSTTDNVHWVWEGRVSNSGFFGFKRLNEGDKPSNYTPWFYSNCNGNASYTEADYTVAVNNAYTGKFKNGNDDASGHDWKWDLPAGRYRIELNAADVNAPVIKIISLNTDFSGLKYVISGTFNGWTAPDTYLKLSQEDQPFTFTYNSTSKVYEWSYTGTMKNVSFKISNMTDAATDNDPHWGKAFGYSYNNDGTVADLTLDNAYQMRRTNVPGEDVFIDFQDTNNNPLTLVNPTFTLDPSNMTLVVKNNPEEEPEETFYWISSEFSGWGNKAMTFVGDGTWTWEGKFASTTMNFGIMKSASSTSETQTGWLSSVSDNESTDVAANPGVIYTCYWKNEDTAPEGKYIKDWVTSGLNPSTTYRVVFNPTAKTVVIYSLAPVTAHYEALEKNTPAGQAVRQAVNNLYVELKPSEYLPVEATDSYSLQIGGKVVANGYVVNNETGLYRFDFMPYFVNDQELTLVASATKSAEVVVKPAGALDVNATKGDVWFEGSQEGTTYYASINLPFTTSSSVVYNFPHVTYTRNDQEGSFEANVVWTDGGFTIVVPQAIVVNNEGKYTGTDVTFTFKFTPVIPFAVYTAPVAGGTGSAAPAAPATNLTLQEFGGKAEPIPLTIKGSMIDVSGVEGVVIEAEDAPVEYYNLQGQRVNGDLAPGIYIRRQGNTVTKVRI